MVESEDSSILELDSVKTSSPENQVTSGRGYPEIYWVPWYNDILRHLNIVMNIDS